MERHQTYSIKCILFDLDNTLIETRKADERACKKIADVLKLKYDLTNEEALSISTKFLRNFRKCPENTHMDLDEWRTYLWSQALGEKHRKHAVSWFET
ncbi:hypothetical protein ABEB36_003349 [Hypothenemus hampei]|uniref:Uncharacterized protein n=1 Tax=Hypothenemus hampei TaxID=57062 RepID=A0ABD1F9K5_HYPHA